MLMGPAWPCPLSLACSAGLACSWTLWLCTCIPLAQLLSPAFTAMHTSVARPCNNRSACWLQSSCSSRCAQLALVLPSYCPGSHWHICVCNQLHWLHRHLDLALATECVYTIDSSHHHYLLWSLPTGHWTWRNCWGPQHPLQLHWTPIAFTKNHKVIYLIDPSGLS